MHLSMRIARDIMGTRGTPGVTPETCGVIGERAEVILV